MNPLSLLGQFEAPEMTDILLWPIVLAAVGFVIWGFGWKSERKGGNPMIKWIAFLPMIVAAWLAKDNFMLSIDTGFDGTAFRDSIGNSKRLIYGSYLAFLLPAAAIVGFPIMTVVDKRMSKYR